MSIGLCMIVRDEAAVIEGCLESARPLIDHWTIVDTGSTDGTQDIVWGALDGIPGELHERPWRNFGDNLTEMLWLARDTADWLLRLDADMMLEAREDLGPWLADDPDPDVGAWMVEIADHGIRYRLPLLVRGGLEWRYIGATHEYLDPADRKQRPLTGLVIKHGANGANRDDKLARDLELLADGMEHGDERSIFYTAETLRFLGRAGEAARRYEQRAALGGFEEERWYAGYQAAKIVGDVPSLIACWRERPWRHEPLTAAARIVAEAGGRGDVLFLEPAP